MSRFIAEDKWGALYYVPGARTLREAQDRASEALGPHGYLEAREIRAGQPRPRYILPEEE